MTEQKEETKPTKPLTLSTTARAGAAKSSDATQVRQKFSHGRTRAVTVEVKKPVKRPGGPAAPATASAPTVEAPAAAPTARTLKLGGGAPATTARAARGAAASAAGGPARGRGPGGGRDRRPGADPPAADGAGWGAARRCSTAPATDAADHQQAPAAAARCAPRGAQAPLRQGRCR